MDNQNNLSLDQKIQKLINNYTDLKIKFSELQNTMLDLRKENNELKEKLSHNSYQSEKFASDYSQLKENYDSLQEENRVLLQKIQEYEKNNQEASSKIDSILDQISDL
jgi:chromosome segregation ATPase